MFPGIKGETGLVPKKRSPILISISLKNDQYEIWKEERLSSIVLPKYLQLVTISVGVPCEDMMRGRIAGTFFC